MVQVGQDIFLRYHMLNLNEENIMTTRNYFEHEPIPAAI